jgi:hypothetical protein
VDKGDLISAGCRYQKSQYQDSEGNQRTGHDFIVDEWNLLARSGNGNGQAREDFEEEEVEDWDDEELEDEDDEFLPF